MKGLWFDSIIKAEVGNINKIDEKLFNKDCVTMLRTAAIILL